MADAAAFYDKLAQWLKDHAAHIKPQTELVIALRFVNSASIRALYQFLRMIKDGQIPLKIVITHLESSDNSDVIELLQEACRLLGLPYEVRKEPSLEENTDAP